MHKDQWRLIISSPSNGAWNMALDEAILESVSNNNSLPTLRLYAWDPPCLSLGQAQPNHDVDLAALATYGWDLVRRPTGGRAILHTDELTYSVAAPLDEPRVSGTILESYRRLSIALLRVLDILELPASADQKYPLPDGTQPNGAVCFEVPSNYEITVNQKKLIGSAQARRLGGVLQHGSLPLTGDLTRITKVLAYPDRQSREIAANRLLSHAATAESILEKSLSWEITASAFRTAFEQVLNITFIEQGATENELICAQELVEIKYGHSDWTFRI
jgi:lipoate-protein ligase A